MVHCKRVSLLITYRMASTNGPIKSWWFSSLNSVVETGKEWWVEHTASRREMAYHARVAYIMASANGPIKSWWFSSLNSVAEIGEEWWVEHTASMREMACHARVAQRKHIATRGTHSMLVAFEALTGLLCIYMYSCPEKRGWSSGPNHLTWLKI
jgi:hypothetical protein